MVEGLEFLVLHCYYIKCGRYNRVCYVSRILSRIGIFAFLLGQRIMGLTLGSL
jgi:hypothetical protein